MARGFFMAKKPQSQAAEAGSAQARALVDLPQFNAKAGDAFEAPAEDISALVASGQADDHPDAVSHAKA